MLATLQYPHIDSWVFRWGSIGLSWYAAMYIIGFTLSYFILRHRRAKGSLRLPYPEDVSLLLTYTFYGVILGARLAYVFIYHPAYYWEHPAQIPAVWNGGMSFHGALVGGVLAIYLFAKKYHLSLLNILDSGAICVPAGLGTGRLGNFINGELYGRVTDLPWGMVFPRGGPLARHPSQLYEALLEGPVLLLIVLWVARKRRPDGVLLATGLIGYGVFRFIIEFAREPDVQLGFILGFFSMGQILCFGMIVAGLLLLKRVYSPATVTQE